MASRGAAAARRVTLLLVGSCLALLTTLPARPAAAAGELPVLEQVLTMPATPEPDGPPVTLDVSLFSTDPQVPRPAVVLAHGFGGTKADSTATAEALARDGYAVITFTARGFGRSGGLIHLNHPRYEGADARRLIDLAAGRREVLHQGDDPVIGFAGGSYGGGLSLLVAGLDRRVDAVAPAFTYHSLRTSLFPQYATAAAGRALADVTPIDVPGVFKQRWASLLFLSAGGGASGGDGQRGAASYCGRFSADLCRGYLATARTGSPDAALVALLAESDLQGVLPDVRAATLLVQGELDTLFPLDQADANLRGLPPSTPARMTWVDGGHDAGIDTNALLPELRAWFGRYLRFDGSPADTAFRVEVPETRLVDVGEAAEPELLSAVGYPGRGIPTGSQRIDLRGGTQPFLAPPGGTPAALTNLPGTGTALSSLASVGGYALAVLPGQSATFTSEPLTEPLALVGSGTVQLEVTSSRPVATLFASLWDLGPEVTTAAQNGGSSSTPGTGVLPGLAVAPVRLTGLSPGRSRSVTVALPPVAHRVPVGHRLQLVLASTDQAYAAPADPATYSVALTAGSGLVLPRLDASTDRSSRLDVGLPLVLVVAGLLLAALVSLVVLWLRRRSDHPRDELRATPLLVEDLVKTYRDGYRAVDGVTFSAAAGQVVGLLGPNGAGKTTTMRMLVGLIRPDSGRIFVHGQPVHAGADVLGSVGAFIEGPGFLPHLTGLQNLTAFWAATGRPAEEAQLDQALEIAGLGSAVHRRVRTYSQGMRQRLGIAQAMLGLPALLLLDEPTNGLDPPQIKAMRGVLADYAASGRTVVVSSHLLSEVEQTCDHVVVMNRGTVVLTGAVAELTAADDLTLIGLARRADLDAAADRLRGLGAAVSVQGDLLRVSGSLPRATLVAHLVAAGHGVESVDGRRQLEEVFLRLVGTPEREAVDVDG